MNWSFGDASTATGSSVVHSFQEAGQFNVTTTATDVAGHSTTASAKVNVTPALAILSGGKDGPNKKCVPKRHIENEPSWCPLTVVTPLLPFADKSYPIGAMQALGVGLVRGL